MRPIVSVLFLLLTVVFGVIFIPNIADELHRIRVNDASDTGLACATGAGETSCSVDLSQPHFWEDTRFMTVTETSPGSGDRTDDATLGADRQTLTVANLTESTSYTFDVAYEIAEANLANADGADDLLRVFPLLFIIGVVVIGVAGGVAAWRA